MMEKDYSKYKAEQFLNDDYFINSQLHPTEESFSFWKKLEESDSSLGKEVQLARTIITQFRLKTKFEPLKNSEVDDIWNKIQNKNNKHKVRKLIRYYVLAAAVAILLLFVVTPQIFQENNIDYSSMIAEQYGTVYEDIQLILSSEDKVIIKENESNIYYNEKGEVKVNSDYLQAEDKTEKQQGKNDVKYNKLIVPAGKRSFLTLSDGSKLWVNSSTTVIYPNRFLSDKREIYIDGEAYLEVAHNPESPFYVKTEQMFVCVLGTSFNVCAYHDDVEQQVVLLAGKVKVQGEKLQDAVLVPDEMYKYNKETHENNITKVDAEDYISWKNGYYKFSGQELSIVFKRLSRYYAKEIIVDKEVGVLRCSGKLNLTEHVDDVLDNIKQAAPIKIEHDHEQIIIRKSNPK